MPEPTGRGSREFLPSANQALAELEETTGKPVMIVDAPELNVLATIRRAGPEDSSHVLRIKDGEKRAADYLIVFQCRMALRDGSVPRAVLRDNPAVREQVISDCEELHSHLPLAKARELGSFIYDSVSEAGFDLALLPEAARERGSEAFREAVTTYYKDAYREAGGRLDVGFSEGQIEVNWEPQAGQISARATITALLGSGRYGEAIPLLHTRLQLEPEHVESLYNLGMVYSDRMQLTEARELLSRAVELDPGNANGQVALGIAALRDNDPDAALGPLEKAVVLAHRNPFALRALGQLLMMKDNAPAALPHLRAAATVAPEDPINLFTYAQCLLAIEGESHETEAGELFKRALRLAPVGELAEKIKNQQRRLAERVMRANAQGLPRLDAVMYLSSALEAYRELEPEGQKQLLAEAGAVGQKDLSINNPEQIHLLKHFRGGSNVSALQVVCILYVGVQLLLPGQDAGIDFAREYELAKGMAGADP